MLQAVFVTNFYTLVKVVNKEEVFKSCINPKLFDDQELEWGGEAQIKVERLDFDPLDKLLSPSIELALKNLSLNHLGFEMKTIWKNTYYKGYFQEIHDHISHYHNTSHLSAVLFLEDHIPNSGQFYFHNDHQLSKTFSYVLDGSILSKDRYFLTPKEGDLIMFPSYMLHGVTPHKIKTPRHTISFNLRRSS